MKQPLVAENFCLEWVAPRVSFASRMTGTATLSSIECPSQTVRGLGGGDARGKDHGGDH